MPGGRRLWVGMKPSTKRSLAIVSLLVISACDAQDPTDADFNTLESSDEQDPLKPLADAQEALYTLTCDLDEQAAVGGLHYPNTTCAAATASAETMLSSWHYRNACNQQVGSDISSPAADAAVSSCYVNKTGSAVVSVDLCCEPPPGPSCDVDEQASVGGLHYPGWTCAAAIANAEASLNSWHYRNACNQQVGSDIGSPVDEAFLTSCTIDGGNAVVSVDLCCEPPTTVSGIPDGTRKMCMEAGTATQMLAECEADAQTNVDRYTSGFWTTQDYITHWGDPCPVGTAIVPNSQFYVANSCNPLPNVGAGCAGPGSFNYEFQAGVLCQ
jgi:hypothetical protein